MAVLTDNDRALVFSQIMRDIANINGGAGALSKAEFRAAVDAADSWVDTNSGSFNTAIPQPARGVLSARQKAALLMYVVAKRFEVS